ncbi:MAG: hypothetical protein J5496_05025 [Lachnospiraceae bacterium]|nr:hypothetical protein [Lachnospiraceae bacterium]
MKNYHEITEELLARRDEYISRQKKKRAALLKASGLVCIFAVAVLVAFGLRGRNAVTPPETTQNSGVAQTQVPGSSDGTAPVISPTNPWVGNETLPVQTLPTQTEVLPPVILPTEPSSEESMIVVPDDVIWSNVTTEPAAYTEWNGKHVSDSLYNALESHPADAVFAIAAWTAPDPDFVWNGRTLADYEREAEEEAYILPEKLSQLLKDGEYLRFGEVLYTSGTPDGEKWAQQLYEDRVAFYGALLDSYLQDGEFLREKLEADIKSYDAHEAQDAYAAARKAYFEQIGTAIVDRLTSQGIPAEYRAERHSSVFYVTRDVFAALEFEPASEWYFGLAVPDGAAAGTVPQAEAAAETQTEELSTGN